MVSVDLSYLSITEAAGLIQKKEVSPLELTRASLDRIAALEPRLHAFITVTPEVALAQAQAATDEIARSGAKGALHGIPIALKDLYETKGIRTTGHSNVLRDNVPDKDATTTILLREAGTVLLGKLSMHEFATGAPGADSAFPIALNPWNTEYLPGGSSSGSGTALAAGMCYGSLGSDTGGSIRGPASICSIVGLKPTYGRVSRYGVLPLSWSLDHAGPMTRTVEDCALLLQAIAGYDPKDGASADVPVSDYSAGLKAGIRGLKIGVPRSWLDEGEGTDPEYAAAFEAAVTILKDLGAEVVDVDGQPFIDARIANEIISQAEGHAFHEEWIRTRPQDYGEATRNRFRAGVFVSAADYINALRARTVVRARVADIFKSVDLIASPAQPSPPQKVTDQNPAGRYTRPSFSNAFNLTGLPAISVPGGFTASGLPIGLQIAGRAFDEATVLRAAYAYEEATPWHERHPAL